MSAPDAAAVGRRVVLVTGASAGIGAACCRVFARAGWDVVGLARRVERLEELGKELQAAAPQAVFLPLGCDVNREEEVRGALEAVRGRFKRLDVLVNNAGIGVYGEVGESSLEVFRLNMETNYFGVLRCTQLALPLLRETARGNPGRWGAAVVMVSSIVGKRAFPGMTAYCASKFALEGLSEGFRLEVARDRISVSVINPSVTRTEFFEVALGRRPPGYLNPDRGMDPARVAQAILGAVRRPRRNLYLSLKGRAGVLLQWLSPRLFDWVVRRTWR